MNVLKPWGRECWMTQGVWIKLSNRSSLFSSITIFLFSHDLQCTLHHIVALSVFFSLAIFSDHCLLISILHLSFSVTNFKWVYCFPKRLTTHWQFSLIELGSLKTSVLCFNFFWPEQGACTPSLYHYIRGMGQHHHGRREIESWT